MIKKLLILLLLCLCVPAVGQVPYQKPMMGQQIDWSNPLSKGLVGYWLMNEGTGNTVQDLSGNGNTGTLVADTHWVPGKFGPCLSFDGTGDYVNIPTSPIFNAMEELTFSGWIKRSGLENPVIELYNSTTDRIYLSCSAVTIWVHNDIGDSGGTQYGSSAAIDANTWYFITWTYDSTKVSKLYINGVQTGSTTTLSKSLSDLVDGFSLYIGFEDKNNEYFNGSISDVSVYNRALSAGEITKLYNNPFGIIQPTFSVWWYSGIGGEPPATYGQVIMISN